MVLATLISKGQLTIPEAIRNSLHLHERDKLEFVITESKETLLRPVTKNVEDVFGRLYIPSRKPILLRKWILG